MKHYKLILGDIFTLAIITIIGFITHGEMNISFLPRMLASFVPLTIAWFLLAPFFRLFEEDFIRQLSQLWRPVWCMSFAAPFAGVIRGLWLGSAISPSFILVFAGISALGLVIWRTIHLYTFKK